MHFSWPLPPLYRFTATHSAKRPAQIHPPLRPARPYRPLRRQVPIVPATLPIQAVLVTRRSPLEIPVTPRPTTPVPLRPRLPPRLRWRRHQRPPHPCKPPSPLSLKIRRSRKWRRKDIRALLGCEETPKEYGAARR